MPLSGRSVASEAVATVVQVGASYSTVDRPGPGPFNHDVFKLFKQVTEWMGRDNFKLNLKLPQAPLCDSEPARGH